MPIYEFRCLQCNHIFELLAVRQDDAKELRCPECSGTEVERVLSRVSYQMGMKATAGARPKVTSKSCSSGSCATIDIPGPSR
ncbi:MAG: zinc ribbon domain-containing protein [Deltaproteobacteria bacterium]|nr:zinc ribbon domain-containing protein [Deltaproteobacteria bacterium]MBW2069889.1 zinc ribbon domain-containing protein [Deltaproteobacteria bacterium]